MTFLYILELESDKYYIGTTKNVFNRVTQHINKKGSAWTKKYAFKELVFVTKVTNNFDEDNYTKEYMGKYGVENVRGGSYCQLVLSENQKEMLLKEINHSNGNCLKCGVPGHFISKCPKKVENWKDTINLYLENKIEFMEIKEILDSRKEKVLNYLVSFDETSSICNLLGTLYFHYFDDYSKGKQYFEKSIELDSKNYAPYGNLYFLLISKESKYPLDSYIWEIFGKACKLGNQKTISHFKMKRWNLCGPHCTGKMHYFTKGNTHLNVCNPNGTDWNLDVPIKYPFKELTWEKIGFFD